MKAWKEQRKLPWAIVALVSFGLFVVYAARNPSQFYRLDSIIVTSEYTTPGKWQTRIMRVARHISQSFEGKYQVEEFAVLKNGRLRVKSCGSPEWILYVPDAVLPDPLEVGWWAWGDCSALGDVRTDPAGVYQM